MIDRENHNFGKISKGDYRLFLKFLKYLLPYRKKVIAVLFLSGLGALLGLAVPYLSKLIIDEAIINKELKSFILFGAGSAAIFLVSGLTGGIADFLKKSVRLRVVLDLNKKVFGHLQKFSINAFQDRPTGEYMFKIDHDVDRVADLIVFVPEEFVSIFPRLFFTIAIIFCLDWRMALFSLILAPVMYLPVRYFTQRMRRLWEELFKNSQDISKRLEEVFSHVYLVKAFAKEKRETKGYIRALIVNLRIALKNLRLEIVSGFTAGSFERAVIGLIALFGGYQVIRGRMTLGTLAAAIIYLTQLVGLQSRVAFFSQRVVFGTISCKRLNEVLETRPERIETTERTKKIIFKEESRIEFKKVSFGYRKQEHILKDIGFKIEKGFVALVGPSGCGKSTIVNLILGLYKPWQGEILIGNHRIEDIDSAALREQISAALQEPLLWNDNIENNIKYGREDAAGEEILKVAQITGVDGFVKEMPRKYETVIGENACRLSEGQKQKIAIARALIKKAKILILDEAMSSMDSRSEERIIGQIKELPIDTIITVSHRLSTVMASDLVYFLKQPGLMVVDRPQQLIEKDEEFRNLFFAQMRAPV